MNEIDELRGKIARKLPYMYPFVYEIGGKHYLIGESTFRECTQKEIEAYKRYREALDQQTCVEPCDVRPDVEEARVKPRDVRPDAVALAREVDVFTKRGGYTNSCQDKLVARNMLNEFLSTQSDAALKALDSQMTDFIRATELTDRYHVKYEWEGNENGR